MTKRAHAAYCLVLAEEAARLRAARKARQGRTSREHFAFEHDNFRAALHWLVETGDADWGLRLGTALFRFWETGEYLAEGRASLNKLLKLPGAAAPSKARSRALFAAAVLAIEQGDWAPGEALLRESQEIAVLLGDKQGIAVCLNARAVLARNQGDLALAHSLFQESLAQWRELRDLKVIARGAQQSRECSEVAGRL